MVYETLVQQLADYRKMFKDSIKMFDEEAHKNDCHLVSCHCHKESQKVQDDALRGMTRIQNRQRRKYPRLYKRAEQLTLTMRYGKPAKAKRAKKEYAAICAKMV